MGKVDKYVLVGLIFPCILDILVLVLKLRDTMRYQSWFFFVIHTKNIIMHTKDHYNQTNHNPGIYTTKPRNNIPSKIT